MKHWMLALTLCLVGGLASCTPDFVTNNQSDVILRVTSVTATAGGAGTGGAFLLSDVVSNTGVFNDNASVTLAAIPKNPTLAVTGQFNDVTIVRYEVRYTRTDGLSQEGVDVPFRVSGELSALVPFNGSATVSFIVVRHQAKEEPPLSLLAGNGGAQVVTMTAQITLHGITTSGKVVEATAVLPITFADFGG